MQHPHTVFRGQASGWCLRTAGRRLIVVRRSILGRLLSV